MKSAIVGEASTFPHMQNTTFGEAGRPAAWVIAVRMGYGHQRTAHPLRGLAPGGEVLLADDYPGMPASDRALWERMRRIYELMSNVHRVPIIGPPAFGAFDVVQRIIHFYPRRDLSRPDWNVRALYSRIRKGWGRHLIERLNARRPILPIVTSFYTPAFMAEFFDYPGDIYCAICDADIARAWASLNPAAGRIKYFAPTRRAAERLRLYGVPARNILLTGYPLPVENVGTSDAEVVKQDLAQRIVNLDPDGRYLERYGALVEGKLGELPPGPTRPLTVMFSVGGAGAQKEIAAQLMRAFRKRLLKDEVHLSVAVGVRQSVRDYMEQQAAACGLAASVEGMDAEIGGHESDPCVRILYGDTIAGYFERFDAALRATDVLWTKPSELSFYSALGVPLVLAPSLGAQEKANQEWLLRLGAGTVQDDPAHAGEWFFDLLQSGWFADAAMAGFVNGEQQGTERITRVLRCGSPEAAAL